MFRSCAAGADAHTALLTIEHDFRIPAQAERGVAGRVINPQQGMVVADAPTWPGAREASRWVTR